ncbi:hypothetical protein ASE12_15365 [Aeromicrobium sp. Root236]|nr:hypothetical protein ASE12_15365 [Aeromicrobium sp. Root236]
MTTTISKGRSMKITTKVSRGLIAAAVSVAVTATGLATMPASASDVSTGLVAWYKLDETSGTTAVDSSGHGRNGTVTGTASWNAGDGFTFGGGANSSGNAITLPNNLLAGLDDVSVDFDVKVDPALSGNWFMFNLGNTANYPNGTGYLFVTNDSNGRYRGTMAAGGFATEQSASRAGGLSTGVWKHVTLTVDGGTPASPGTSKLYEDGLLVASNSNITAKPSDLGEPDGTTTRNVLGRSAYAGDLSFKGTIRDFRIYDRALDAGDAATLSAKTSTAVTTADKASLTLGDTSAVTADLTLPVKGSAGSTITWASSAPSTVSSAGAVTRPAHGAGDAAVTLTATITHGAVSTTKDFAVTVLEDELDDAGKVQAALDAIELVHPDDVRGNLTLPTKGSSGTTISWSSSKPGVVTATGEVTRPAHGADPVEVTLTATGTLGSTTGTRDIVLTVKPAPAPLDFEAYAFAYFAGESTDDGEKIYMGASKGDDPLDYDELNDGKPVLASQFGTKGLRDPFIIRSHEGDRFYLLATDLKAYPAVDFGEAQETGSKYLEVWESTDLVHWGNQRHVKVSSDFAGNTWAPESYYDENTGEYVVYWASALYPTTQTAGRDINTSYQRMMYATTRDFVTFSDPKPWIDVKRGTGKGMIDATVVKDGDTFYRVVKDEAYMIPRQEKSTDLLATVTGSLPTTTSTPGWQLVKEKVGLGQPNPWGGTFTGGEGPTVFRDNDDPDHWIMFIDQPSYHGGQGYMAFETHDIASADWTAVPDADLPSSPRHGTVLPVTQDELDRMRLDLQPNLLVESVDPLTATTKAGTAPVLPAKATVHFADGSTAEKTVDWDAVDPSKYADVGTFEVQGDVAPGSTVRATATVTVTDALDPSVTLTTDPVAPDGEVGWWTTAPVKVTAAGFDDREVAGVETSVDEGPWVAVEDDEVTVQVTGEGKHSVRARATDASGNVSPVQTLDLKVDTAAPISKATVAAGRTVTLVAADETSGVARVESRLGTSGDWTTGSSVQVGSGETAVQFRAVDKAGNAEEPNSVTVPAVGQGLHDSVTVATLSASKVRYGSNVTVTARVNGAGPTPTGQVRVLDGDTLVGTGTLAGGRATVTVSTKDLGAVGVNELTVRYDGDAEYRASDDTVTLTVIKAAGKVSLSIPSKIKPSSRATIKVTVLATPATPVSGRATIRVRAGGKYYVQRTVTLDAKGKATVTLPRLGARSYAMSVAYAGSPTVDAVVRTVTLRVVR